MTRKKIIYREELDLLLEKAGRTVVLGREKYFTPCCIPGNLRVGEKHLFCVPEKVRPGKERYLFERFHCGPSFETCGPLAKIELLQAKCCRSGNQIWYRGSYKINEVYND